jgi:hypothetical protein
MAQQKTTRERRAEGRASRRARAPEIETPDVASAAESAPDEGGEDSSSADTLKAAASAALAAAAVGAARAFAQRRKQSAAESEREDAQDEESTEEPERSQAPMPESADMSAEEDERADEQEDEPEQRDPVPPGRARAMIDSAKQHLRDLRGTEAEAVSSVRRTGDGWRVALDVVEVHRVPDSTDVLGTYELDLDDEGELITLERTGRFYRSEADRR